MSDSLSATISLSAPIIRSPRVMQVEGIFDLAPSKRSQVERTVSLPLSERPWSIGLIVGPSGAGKSQTARALFGDKVITSYEWDSERSIIDGFPETMSIKDVVGLLSSVGFSSAPHWLRPFHTLSTGEQFRVTLARALADESQLICVDEFTSVVDRTIAQIGSAAVAKSVRRSGKQLVAVTCHYDVEDWLQPDWVYQPASDSFAWRLLRQRPEIEVTVKRVHHSAWELFRRFHYLDQALHKSAACYVGFIDGQPTCFVAVLSVWGMSKRGDSRPRRRAHRTVCLPDFQGVGIGNAMGEYVASLYRACGMRYMSTTSHPAMIRHRARSRDWKMVTAPSLRAVDTDESTGNKKQIHHATTRKVSSFEYVGASCEDVELAERMIIS